MAKSATHASEVSLDRRKVELQTGALLSYALVSDDKDLSLAIAAATPARDYVLPVVT